ncbi:putative RNA-directed DNA polymerase from mobile element jockey-like [Apostichopus japonicus]|uniref:Putative RNA-directed DNA polymerase from mobile element jockey-like n=1 Tax=Stichopus japonicus TaxID=307972 RepID=A0A2G8KEH5_STIJA|nr:putative RNA-directed DNA polymerase from mobile element jockey-like [Apostichopus japonicus]
MLLSSHSYCCCIRTHVVLLRVCNDLLQTVDRGDEAVLVLLDFSAAFDTIDHLVLIARLEERYGITDKALDWFVSYLENRKQAVAVETALSDALLMDCGMPQGSVAGPVIFTMYSAPIEDIASSNGIECMTYADDTQLHISMNPSNRDVSVSKLEQCLADIKSWTVRNKFS